MTGLPTWADQMKGLDSVVDNLVAKWRPDGATEAELQDMNKLALSILACGYLCHVYTDAKRPVFMPLWNYAFNQGGPNPDYVYSITEVDPAGVYEISGTRGTTRFVEIEQQAAKMTSNANVKRSDSTPMQVTNDLDQLTLGDDGSFRVILSAEKPEGYDGDWWPLDERAKRLMMRKCACDWNNEVDARVTINRLDDPGGDMTPEETARRFSEMADWVEGMIEFCWSRVEHYREHHGYNVLLPSEWMKKRGGLSTKQRYYDGIYRIDDDEALVVEFPVPTDCFYWQILVADDRYCTVDWVNRLSSINDAHARVDPDGVFRAVVAKQDPGVHNWLDKADYPDGVLQARFYNATDYPDATVTKVPVAKVFDHLPAGTPRVTPEERAEQLRLRREGAQLRRIW